MIIGLAALLVLAVVGAVVLVGVAAGGTSARRGEGFWVAGGVGVLVVGALFVVALLAIVGVGGRSGGEHRAHRAATYEPRKIEGVPASYDDFVALDRLDSELVVPQVVHGRHDGDVVQVSGRGFPSHTSGVLAQCDGTTAVRCSNVVDVQTDADGTFRVAYRVDAEAEGPALVVAIAGDRRVAVLDLGTAAPWPVLRLDGSDLVVTGVPASGLDVARCPRDAVELAPCERVHRVAPGASTARITLPPLAGESASEVSLVVLDGGGTVLDEPIVFGDDAPFADPAANVDVPAARVAVGLGVAALLVALAVVLVRRTDWRPPAESDVGG